MSLSTNQRRDQRRRLVASWKRPVDQPEAARGDSPRTMAAYDPEAHPEQQRGPGVLLPTGLGGLTVAIVAAFVPLAAVVAAGATEHLLGRPLLGSGGRFARTLAAAGAMVDPRGVASLQTWLASTLLVVAAVVALVVRLMRRHRRDDFKGRYRAWGWMATVFVAIACSGSVPVGRLVGAAVADATGITLGPDGIGWWLSLSAVVMVAVSLWAVLPLHERLGTGIWLGCALTSWGVAAVATWMADGRDRIVVAGAAAWTLASGFALAAMLTAARSVIREVRGQCGVKKPKAVKAKKAEPTRDDAEPVDEEVSAGFESLADSAEDGETTTQYVDGSEEDQRHLSKAERKRLRKLARMNGAAA